MMAVTRFSGVVSTTDSYLYGLSIPIEGPLLRSGLYYGVNSAMGEGTGSLSNNTIKYCGVIVGKTTSFDRIGVNIMTLGGDATAVAHLGIYFDTGFNAPGALLLDAGTVNAGTQAGNVIGAHDIAIALTLFPGVYWLVSCGQLITGTAPVEAAVGLVGVPNIGQSAPPSATVYNGYTQAGVTGALPATATPVYYSGSISLVQLHVM
jgi:hypothetical protein